MLNKIRLVRIRGKRIRIVREGESWGFATVSEMVYRGKKLAGIKVKREGSKGGGTMIVSPNEIRRFFGYRI